MASQDRVREAFAAVRREDFLPREQRGFAREDRALPIGYRQTNSQPTTVLNLLMLLDVRPGHKVLDVGSGSGWTTGLIADLVGDTGSVHGVEIVPELVAWSRENLSGYEMPWAEVRQAEPDTLGLPDVAPFDRILVSAEASRVPSALVEQLADGGVMVVPVAGRMTAVRRTGDETEVAEHGFYAFVPLIEPDES